MSLPELKGTEPLAKDDAAVSILKDAIMNQYQGIIAGGVLAASAIAGFSPLPILLWLGAEFIVLPLIDTPPVRRWVLRKKREKERQSADLRREKAIASLEPARRETWRALNDLCYKIEMNYRGLSGISQFFIAEQTSKLDRILNGCLQRMIALQKYQTFTKQQKDVLRIEKDIAMAQKQLQDPNLSGRVRSAIQKNLQLKKSLLQSQVDASQTQVALGAELDSLSSLLELLHQKSLSIRDPQAIAHELDAIVTQVTDTDRSIREMEALMATGEDSLAADVEPIPAIGGSAEKATPLRDRVKNL